MKRFFSVVVCFAAISLSLNAQRTYYIYLQTDNQQPFFVKMDNKIYSSSASGYLILSRLRDTTHNFSLGFPMKEGEYRFYCTMNHKDHGYLVKNFGETGWGLFDLQTLGVQMPSRITNEDPGMIIRTERKEPNDFTALLSKAANDTTLNQKIVILHTEKEKPGIQKPVEVQTDSAEISIEKVTDVPANIEVKKEETGKKTDAESDSAIVLKSDSAVLQPVSDMVKGENKVDSSKPAPGKTIIQEDPKEIVEEKKQEDNEVITYKPSKIVRRSESSTTEGFGLVFIDEYPDGKKDTIRILIPAKKTNIINAAPVKKDEIRQNEGLKFIEITYDTSNREAPPVNKETSQTAKNDCRHIAGDDDFFRLRKEMAAAITDEKMIAESRKEFKTKCFTTEQIRNLGNLFLTDEGKFHFFDAAFYFVSDLEKYPSLESELKDEQYISRFKLLIKK